MSYDTIFCSVSLTVLVAVPVPEPRKLTDEELKKYGIHMASRLNEDDAQGQNKWADIDDDDEDWAPEAITWGDGTKTTLPHSDEHPVPVSESESVPSKDIVLEDGPKAPSSIGPASPATFKPGGLPSGKGLVLKVATQEKPALVAKPLLQPAPTKSPWAQLPPVERASPALADSARPARVLPKESSLAKNPSLPTMITKEVTTDEFSRSAWRDRGSHGNKELYNSRSGRYEPVTERQPSIPSDPQIRYSTLLQRPQLPDQPAESLSALSSHRPDQDGVFGRRRGSSNVSGGSASFLPRMVKGADVSIPSSESLGVLRMSSAGCSSENPTSPEIIPSSSLSRNQHQAERTSRSSPGTNFLTPQLPGISPELGLGQQPHSVEDDVEFQRRLMREGIELARKRRQEEVAQEEAARKERIQKKLESLGPPPEKKNDGKDSVPKDCTAKPKHIQQREASESMESKAQVTHLMQPDKADIKLPNCSGETEQRPQVVLPTAPPARRLSQTQEGKPSSAWGGVGPRPDRFISWVAGAPRNVWGSPDSDRGLGNGTFNPDLGRVTEASTQSSQTNLAQSPIAPPNNVEASTHIRPRTQTLTGSHGSRYDTPGSDFASTWVAAVADSDDKISAARFTERVGRERQLAERGLSLEDAQPTIKDTWRQVHVPGDGTRRVTANVDMQPHSTGSWKPSREVRPTESPPVDESTSGFQATKAGCGTNTVVAQSGSTGTAQSRLSRFFPARDIRMDTGFMEPTRPTSPSPPPPTMEGHPVYEGDVLHPQVSLPRPAKPYPVVKLPPSSMVLQCSQSKPSVMWTTRASKSDSPRAPIHQSQMTRQGTEGSPENWQDRINILLNGGKSPFAKTVRDDSTTECVPNYNTNHDCTPLLMSGVTWNLYYANQGLPTTKSMAEECFEEQEMGSLPQIRLPHKAPEAAWQPALAQTKPLPKRFCVQASIMEPFYFSAEVVGGGNAFRIHFPGMCEPKVVTGPFSATRGGRGGSHARPTPRHRSSAHISRGGKSETTNPHANTSGTNNNGRAGRGAYRSRGPEPWSRYSHPSPSQTSLSA